MRQAKYTGGHGQAMRQTSGRAGDKPGVLSQTTRQLHTLLRLKTWQWRVDASSTSMCLTECMGRLFQLVGGMDRIPMLRERHWAHFSIVTVRLHLTEIRKTSKGVRHHAISKTATARSDAQRGDTT